MKSAALGLAASLAASMSGTCLAGDLKAEQKFTDTQIGFDAPASYSNFNLSISGPNGIRASAESKSGAPSIDLKSLGTLDDGIYHYELTASTGERIPLRAGLDDGREGVRPTSMLKSASASGHFQVKGGTIVKFDPAAREDVKRQK